MASKKLNRAQRRAREAARREQYEKTQVALQEKHLGTRDVLLFNKKGTKSSSRIDRVLSGLDIGEREYAMAFLEQWERDINDVTKKDQFKDKRYSLARLLSKISISKIEKAILNTGLLPEDLARQYGVPVDALLNPDNWDHSQFSWNGKTYDFVFTYKGDILVES